MGFGLYLQHVEGLEPCPLCVVQRLAFVLAGGFAALGVVVAAWQPLRQALAALAALSAFAGAGVATWHVWLIAHPPETASCGRPFAWMLDHFALATLVPKIFSGEGDCLKVDWTLFGLSIPQIALGLFLVMGGLAMLATRARPR